MNLSIKAASIGMNRWLTRQAGKASGLKISSMTGKLAGILAINVSPLDNHFCNRMSKVKSAICSQCYSRAMLRTSRISCRSPWKNNGEILSTALIPEEKLPFIPSAYCRINAHGELINEIHAENILRIIRANYQTTFGFWTKRPELVIPIIKRLGKPVNCILVYSSPYINVRASLPNCFDKVFTCYGSQRAADIRHAEINCAGRSCINCRLCYTQNPINQIGEIVR